MKTRDGKAYGSLVLTVSTIGLASEKPSGPEGAKKYNPPGQFQIRYVLNPTGSRSLETDPKRAYKTYKEYLKAEKQK